MDRWGTVFIIGINLRGVVLFIQIDHDIKLKQWLNSSRHQVLCNRAVLGVGALCLLQCHHGWIPEAAELTTCKKVRMNTCTKLCTKCWICFNQIDSFANMNFSRMVVGVRQGCPVFVQWVFLLGATMLRRWHSKQVELVWFKSVCTGPPGWCGGVQPRREVRRGESSRPSFAKVLFWSYQTCPCCLHIPISKYPHISLESCYYPCADVG